MSQLQRSSKAFGIYWWDTFDPPGDDTNLIGEADTFALAEAYVEQTYADRLHQTGADHIEIVRERDGVVVKRYTVR